MAPMHLIGTVKDIHPNSAKPQLELSFRKADISVLSSGKKAAVTLHFGETVWQGTMCNEGQRDAYVHSRLHCDAGPSASCTDVLVDCGLAHKARLEFSVLAPDDLQLLRVLDPGTWRTGRAPSEGSGRSASEKTKRAPIRTANRTVAERAPGAFPFDNRAAILELADQYWAEITANDAAEERAFEEAFREARAVGFLSKQLFVRVGRWKSVRQTPNYESNSDGDIRRATSSALIATTDAAALTALEKLRGVALRTASAILHWLQPERFPIFDVRVLRALGNPQPRSYEDLLLYSQIADRIRALSSQHNLDLRTIDRALWTWDKIRSRRRR